MLKIMVMDVLYCVVLCRVVDVKLLKRISNSGILYKANYFYSFYNERKCQLMRGMWAQQILFHFSITEVVSRRVPYQLIILPTQDALRDEAKVGKNRAMRRRAKVRENRTNRC